MSKEAQEIFRQDLNNAPREQAASTPAAEESPLPLTQPMPQEQLFQQRLAKREIVEPQRPVQWARTIPPFGLPRSCPKYPSDPIFPSLVTRTPTLLVPSAESLLAPWHGDLLYNTFTSLVILLQWKMAVQSLLFKQSTKDSIKINLGNWTLIPAIQWIMVWAIFVGYMANL
jgi:hypothetical protein